MSRFAFSVGHFPPGTSADGTSINIGAHYFKRCILSVKIFAQKQTPLDFLETYLKTL